jgi:N-acetylmuramoyl-L-alanine amidase
MWGIEVDNPGKLELQEDSEGNILGYKPWFSSSYDADDPRIHYKKTDEHGSGYWLEYEPRQLEAVEGILLALKEKLGGNEFHITTHWQISPGRKIDPNPLFPIDQIRGRINGRLVDDGPDAYMIVDTNMREWPSISSKIITVIPEGKTVDVIRTSRDQSTGDKWYLIEWKIRDEKYQGFVHSGLLEFL